MAIFDAPNADVETFDIPTAYLNAFLHEDKLQVMRMPKYLADLIIKVDPKAMWPKPPTEMNIVKLSYINLS